MHNGPVRYQEPDFLPWDGKRVPLTFVAGYLGAGKTTVINELLARTDRPIAVLVNDVGAVNIDARLIKRRDGDTIELTDGCVCCSMIDGFGAAFDQIRARPQPPDHLIVELSGLAEPDRVTPWGNSAGFRLDGVVVLIDVEQFDELLDREISGTAMVSQAAAADLLVLTKTDLVDAATEEGVRRRLEELVPGVPLVTSKQGMATAGLLGLGGRRPGGTGDLPPVTLFDQHEVDYRPLPRPITRDDIDRLIDALPSSVVRAKGIAEDPDGRRLLIQVVGRRRSVTELPIPEDEPPTDLVVISTVG